MTTTEGIASVPAAAASKPGSGRLSRILRRPEAGAAAGTALVFVFFAAFGLHAGFLDTGGYVSWLAVAAELGIVALAVGMLMIAGEFDLSVGSVVAASSMIVAVPVAQFGWPLWLAIVLALAFGVLIGLVNGLLVVTTGLPSFIVTLVTLFAVAGAALSVSRTVAGTTTVSVTTSGFAHDLFAGHVGSFNVSLIWWLAVAVIGQYLLQSTGFGNWVFSIGGDLETARLNGVPVRTVKLRLYMYSGFSAALVGVIQAVEFNNADVTRGQSFVFEAIVAAVVGGSLLSGGYGSVAGIVFGTMTYSIVSVGIYYTGWNPDLVQLFVGVLLFVAVVGNNFVRRLALSRP
ncbi:ABC transporter permease [Streptomyces sp. NPDC008092]|uniref:ABC transporter permease n=1 Tax=Streptomyces sp. NPDC008092 TaxID=3364808 RepID=UPI0036EA3FF4